MKNNQESLPVNNNEKINTKSYEVVNDPQIEKASSKEHSENNLENHTEKAKQEALEAAITVEKKSKESEKITNSPKIVKRSGPISRKQMNESYRKTIKQVQNELNPTDRLFSKITHNTVIEKVSDFTANTIAKPNAMLSGAIMAFVLTLLTYTIAKKIGYELSGFETIGAFAIGWLLGNLYDFFKVMFTGRK
jgi:hypothetical protein